MGCDVFANNSEIACKAGGGKVIASFPDVCLTPPPPPAGPIPVPYPNTSFSKDMKKGSKSVKIKGKEVMLKDQSFYKTSPLGNEAATKGQGAGVITHTITGKTYFVTWSMDVKFEGQNVDRHMDMTTSNHASPMANAFIINANSAKMVERHPKYGNQTCRNEVRAGAQKRQKKIESQLNANENCNPNADRKIRDLQDSIPCSALKKRVKVLTKLLAVREEKQAKCFNDPSKDKTKKHRKDRRDHDQAIDDTRKAINNTKDRARKNCKPKHPMAGL